MRWITTSAILKTRSIGAVLALASLLTGCLVPRLENPAGTDFEASDVAAITRALWRGDRVASNTAPPSFLRKSEAVGVVARHGTVRYARAWGDGGNFLDNLERAIEQAKRSIPPAKLAAIDILQVSLTHSYRNHWSLIGRQPVLSNRQRGIFGLELKTGDKIARFAPTYFTVTNRTAKRVIAKFGKPDGVAFFGIQSGPRIRTFESEEFLVSLSAGGWATRISRGNTYVPIEAVDRVRIDAFARAAMTWVGRNTGADGKMVYMYWPSANRVSPKNNFLRQWMGSFVLVRAAAFGRDPDLFRTAEKNIDYNLAKTFRQIGPFGLLEFRDRVKLGALSFAVLAIMNHPNRSKWAGYEQSLRATIRSLWNPDGSFRTFFKPKERNDNQNFYPGEALLLEAQIYERERDPALLERLMKSFRYYRNWHRAHWNPAFIPWHTQAYYRLWKITKDPELATFIFEMNDRLIKIQQTRLPAEDRDMEGRFYATGGRYGPPHASSTAVYLEGLIDAYALAVGLHDQNRRNNYGTAIRGGFRSLIQLQFIDDIDQLYIHRSRRWRTYGGLRTTVYDNRIRNDNVFHGLRAAIKLLSVAELRTLL